MTDHQPPEPGDEDVARADPGEPGPGSGVYALHATSEAERGAFEAALAEDEVLAREVAELQATAAMLGLAAAEAEPEGLRAKVLAEVERTRQDPPARTDDAIAPEPTPELAPGPMPVPDPDADDAPVSLAARRGDRDDQGDRDDHGDQSHRGSGRDQRARAASVLGVAAGVLAVVALALGAWVLDLRTRNADLTVAGAEVSAVLTAPDARTVSGTVEGQDGRAAVVSSPSLGRAVLVAEDLQPVSDGQTYQLWFVGADGSARSAGTFAPDDGSAVVALAGSPGTAAAVGMTVEPAGGSAQPTTAPVLAVPLA